MEESKSKRNRVESPLVNDLSFLYQDTEIFAVYKPAGLHSVRLPDGAGGSSLADMLISRYPKLSSVAKSEGHAGLISRLDRDTSGVIVGAFSQELWEQLYQMLLTGKMKKSYVALVHGRLSEERSFSSYIGSPNRGARKVKVYEQRPAKSARALPGTTHFLPLSVDTSLNVSLVTVLAAPARRHQVRAHAAYIGHPLVGDSLYGSTESVERFVTTPRSFFLHSRQVTFTHPRSGEQITIESPLMKELVWGA